MTTKIEDIENVIVEIAALVAQAVHQRNMKAFSTLVFEHAGVHVPDMINQKMKVQAATPRIVGTPEREERSPGRKVEESRNA